MKTTDWQLQVEVENLDMKGVNDFLWQVQGGHGSGVPIEGSIYRISTLHEGITQAEMVELRGSWRGAGAILDEFAPKLSPKNGEVRICFYNVTESDYQSLIHATANISSAPGIEYTPPSLTVTFKDTQILGVSNYCSLFCGFIPAEV